MGTNGQARLCHHVTQSDLRVSFLILLIGAEALMGLLSSLGGRAGLGRKAQALVSLDGPLLPSPGWDTTRRMPAPGPSSEQEEEEQG